MGITRRVGAATGALVAFAALAACTPPPGSGGTTTTLATEPTPPVISTFVVRGTVGNAPASVALSWSIYDPNGETMTCSLDGDGDGTADLVVDDCSSGTRVVPVASEGDVTATLTVDDGSDVGPTTATRAFSVGADPVESFDLELRGVESLDPDVAAAFTAAAARWESIIVRGTTDFPVASTPSCMPAGSTPLPPVVDDLIIDVSVVPIDGAGGVLGQAGPTCITLGNQLAVTGVMEFDVDDVADLLLDGGFEAVVLHEMGHVLGIGTLWDLRSVGGSRNLTSGAGTAGSRFTGFRAVAEYSVLGGIGNVPVENTGGPGTRDAHWRESVFGNELMTGWLDAGDAPMSRMTIASLADMGYQVDLDAADEFSFSTFGAAARGRAAADHGEVLRPPVGAL